MDTIRLIRETYLDVLDFQKFSNKNFNNNVPTVTKYYLQISQYTIINIIVVHSDTVPKNN